MEILVFVWLAVAVLFIVGELFTLDLTLALLGGAAATAGVSAAVGAPLYIQLPVFIVSALFALFLIRPIAKKHMHKIGQTKTGVDRLPGKAGIAIEPVTADGGLIKLDGENWSAKLDELISTDTVPAGNKVTVLRIEGATAIVHAID